ncbi:Ubiquitin-like protein [Kalmusia sp. IMI 367209]|nr:Ubiquitin-like protein [Kalmusia sp. IMI 367209]
MSQSPDPRLSDDDDKTEAPLTMAASVILTQLPQDARKALETAGELKVEKVRIHLTPIGNAPRLTQLEFQIKQNNRFEVIVRQIRKRLKVQPHESVFCYIGNVFSPGLDESIGNLWRCFKQGQKEELYVGYAMSPAFG